MVSSQRRRLTGLPRGDNAELILSAASPKSTGMRTRVENTSYENTSTLAMGTRCQNRTPEG